MKVNDFDFLLPKELIAQSPLEKRDNSKLMVLNQQNDSLTHDSFYNIVNYFNNGDVLVLNETKVLPARLFGKRDKTGANIEILLLKELEKDVWETLVKPARKIKVDDVVLFDDLLTATCLEVKEEGIRVFKLKYDGIFIEILDKLGSMPLPPYITERLEEKNRYQTVYANTLGSAAAPTAGLHFTNDLLTEIRNKGVEILYVTLHVGLGTFRPVSTNLVEEHHMHSEEYFISEEVSNKLNDAVSKNKKIIAVGTTSIRVLESNFNDNKFSSGKYNTNIFIYPGYKFRVVDELITNFHLPKSSLIMLVSAFYNQESVMKAYNEAINHKYRFFSFGDSMYIKGAKRR